MRILCEGPTEQNFVTQVLGPHLREFMVFAKPELLHRGRGGIVPFKTLRTNIKSDVGRSRAHEYVSTLIDLYGLGDYPGADKREGESVAERVNRIETEMAKESEYSRVKPIAGPIITARIGLDRLRNACPHFGAWVSRLERLSQEP